MSIWGGGSTGGVGVCKLDFCESIKTHPSRQECVPASERGGGRGSKKERKIEQSKSVSERPGEEQQNGGFGVASQRQRVGLTS